ncbi:hypothetical protein V8G54_020489, partial [Vigna mungo]
DNDLCLLLLKNISIVLIHVQGYYRSSSCKNEKIALSCERSGTVKRLIYTASVVSASPLKEDGSDFKDVMDETCWTPLNDSLEYVFLDPFYKIVQNEIAYKTLKFLEGLLGKIPLAHIDVCEAHIFCMESTSINGRFLCASSYISLQEMANHYARYHPEFNVKQE